MTYDHWKTTDPADSEWPINDEPELKDFQLSNDGKAYKAIYDLQNAIDDLRNASPDILRLYVADIAGAVVDLGTILNAITIREAAE